MKFVTIDAETFRDFAATSPYQSFMQTPEIAALREKSGWVAYYFAVTDNAKTATDAKPAQIKAAAMVVAKPTFLGKSTFICPGGPLMDYEDAPLVRFFLKHLRQYAKSHNGYVLSISPYYELVARDRDGAKIAGGYDRTPAVKTLETLGFQEIPHASQPKYMFAMDLNGRSEAEILADFKRNTRNHVKKAEKLGVTVRELSRDDLKIFKQITEQTSKRRGFSDRPLSYYEEMYDLFASKGEIKFLVAEAIIGPEEGATPLSVAMFMLTGNEVVYLFSGSDEKYMKDYNAQYLIQWEILKYAAAHGFRRYNFYGIHDLPKNGELDGIYEFKKGFDTTKNAHVLEFLGTFETSTNTFVCALHKLLSKLHP